MGGLTVLSHNAPPPPSLSLPRHLLLSFSLFCLPVRPPGKSILARYFAFFYYFSLLCIRHNFTQTHHINRLTCFFFLHPLSVAAINRIACTTTVIGGPCPSDGTQFFVCVSLSVTNGANLSRSGFPLFLCQARRRRGLFCGTACLFCCFVAIQLG